MRTVLVSETDLQESEVVLEGETHRHLFRSARQRRGDRLRLVDGVGQARWGEVVDVDRSQAMVKVLGEAPSNEPAVALEIRVAAPKGNRASWLVEKATELGVVGIQFFRCGRGPRSYGGSTLGRLQRVARSAVEQCHRSRVPVVSGMLDFRRALEDLPPSGAFHLDPDAPQGPPTRVPAEAVVMIGPEGGFRPSELEALGEVGSRGVRLGSAVLRIETAALAAVACFLHPAPSDESDRL
ncbi:MAG: RsmE family RNA methyltransferase [Acidobacteriota bacterium]|nr:RsmE family RNA methyltransferase [Acidobacteriota bacterium]